MPKMPDNDDGDNIVIDRPPAKDRERQDLVPPPKYAVVMLNDDFTPMDFVVLLLIKIFLKSQDEAEAVMIEVHEKGKGLAGTYPKDIAETKAYMANRSAQNSGHPFQCQVEALH
jgi:ATP-dependent Clp protease adaptor protein ClpS